MRQRSVDHAYSRHVRTTVMRGLFASSDRCLFLYSFALILFFISVLSLWLAKIIEVMLRQLLLPPRLRRSVFCC